MAPRSCWGLDGDGVVARPIEALGHEVIVAESGLRADVRDPESPAEARPARCTLR